MVFWRAAPRSPSRIQITGVPAVVKRVKDLVLPQLWQRLQPQLDSVPDPGTSICQECGQKKKKKKESGLTSRKPSWWIASPNGSRSFPTQLKPRQQYPETTLYSTRVAGTTIYDNKSIFISFEMRKFVVKILHASEPIVGQVSKTVQISRYKQVWGFLFASLMYS